LALGARSPVLVPPGMYQGAFATTKNRARGLPAPPGAPPVLGSVVWSAEGLPSTRNWPFRWPLSATHAQPAPGDTQGNVSRQLAGAVVLGGGDEREDGVEEGASDAACLTARSAMEVCPADSRAARPVPSIRQPPGPRQWQWSRRCPVGQGANEGPVASPAARPGPRSRG
jgi:hypothetical protein